MDSFANDPFDRLAQDADRAEEAVGHQRSRSRDSLFLMARMTVIGSDSVADVRVRNLSETGLMAEVATPLPLGTQATFDIRGIGPVSGQVVWYAEGRIGVALDAAIDPKLARKPVGGRSRR